MKKPLFLILVSLTICFIFPNEAHAGISDGTINILSKIADSITQKVSDFTLKLFAAIGVAYKGIYASIAIIVVTITIYLWSNSKVSLDMVISLFVTLKISALIALSVSNFKDIIYYPFFDAFYKLCAAFAKVAGTGSSDISTVNNITDIITVATGSIASFAEVLDTLLDKSDIGIGSIWAGILVLVTVGVMKFMFAFLLAYFVVMITIAIFSIHMIMIFMPITLSLFAFKSYRAYSYNSIKNIFHYALSAFFCCIVMSLSISLIDDLVNQVKELENLSDLTFMYVMATITTGLLGYVFIKSSSEFASRVLNTVGGGVMTSSMPAKIAALTAAAPIIKNVATKIGAMAAKKFGNAVSDRGGYGGLAKSALKSPFKGANAIKEYMQATKNNSLNSMKSAVNLNINKK